MIFSSRKVGNVVKRTWWLAWLFATTLLLLSVSTVFAATSTTGFTIWPSKTTTEVNKVWSISFDSPLLSTSVNNNTVYVTDSKQTKVATTIKLSTDGFSVTVTPSKAYVNGDYNLYITNEITSQTGVKLGGMIIVPFTVVVPTLINGANIVVTATDDLKSGKLGDLSGTLSIEGPNGYRSSSYLKDVVSGKYTFSIFENGDYTVKYFSVSSNGILNTQSLQIPSIKLPTTISTTATTVKTANFVIATKEGVEGGKSGSIGGSILPEKWGVPVTVSNSTATWTTTTDIDGKFMIYLPTGSYTLVVDGNDTQYKKHSYKMTVTAGQMATPIETINGEDPLNKLGLQLGAPAEEMGSGVLGGIDATTKEIDGNVNSDATVYIYDTAPAIPVLLKTVKPDTNGKFVAKFTTALTGKKLQIKVIDVAGNVYTLEMASVV